MKRQESREQGSEERLNSAVEGEKTAIQFEALGTRTPDTVTVTFCTS
jgi:rubrerythrin